MARVCEKLTSGFRAHGHSVDIVAGALLPRLLLADVRLSPLLPHWGWVHELATRADVISLHGPIPAFSDFFLAMDAVQRDMPPIGYTHHMDIKFRKLTALTGLYGRLYGQLAGRADVTIVSTSATARTLPAPWRRKTHVVPFGVDLHRVRHDVPKASEFTLLFVGQLRPYKGVDVLLKAMRRLPGVKLNIVGKGYADEKYKAMAARFGLRNVHFLGGVSDDELWRLYAESHVFVLPSTEMEFFGLVILEAMASGCAPIISDLPGPVEVVGDVGRVVPRLDVDALVAAISELRDSPATLAAVSERARERASGYTWERCVEQYLGLYDGIRGAASA
jgi:rhamnosyl/mannosyltransferase